MRRDLIGKALHRILHYVSPSTLQYSKVDGFGFYHTWENKPEGVSEFLYRGHEVYDIIPKLEGVAAVDIGANLGCYTVRLAERFCRVYAFEPNPEMYYLLRLNIQQNHQGHNTIISRAAVSDKNGKATLRLASHRPYATTLAPVHYDWLYFDGEMPVQTVTIDHFFRDTEIDFIKIDVEGHELAVLHGATHVLQRDHPLIAVEIHRTIDRSNPCQCGVCLYLRELGYVLDVRDKMKDVHWVVASGKK